MKSLNILYICVLIALTAFFNSCSYNRDCVNASGNEVTKSRTVDEFSKINVGGSVKIFLKQGAQQSVIVKASDNIQPLIRTRISGSELIIDTDNKVCHAGNVEVYLTVKKLDAISISGDVTVTTQNQFNIEDLSIDISGSSKLKLDLRAKNIRTNCSGGAEIELTGMALSNSVHVSGSVKLKAKNMAVGKYDVGTSGSSELEIYVLDELNVEASGMSDITYRGNPGKVNNQSSGMSSLKKID